ncbi:MAG: hypothetical protein IJW27_02250, partial [Clostridia bacterium]|nr:hypothetical protein [Clostridia bacterium]
MKKKIISLLLSVLIIFCSLPITASAAGTATVVVESVTVSQGGSVALWLRADNFVNVAVLDIELFYDSDLMSVSSVTNGNFFSGASVSTNKDTPGVIKISAMSVSGLTSTTSAANNRMVKVNFKVKVDCPVGKYPITVAVGDAYDNDLNPTPISGQDGYITVKETSTSKSFPLSITAASTAKQNDIWSLKVYHSSSSSYSFASADFQVEYDREHFALDSVELAAALKKDDAVYSINTSIQGIVIISYAATTAIATSDLFTVKLKAIAEEDVSTKVTITASDVYNDDLVPYSSTTVTKTVALTAAEVLPDYPDLYLTEGKFIVGQQETLSLALEGGAPVAAGDFTVTYDPAVFRCDEVTVSEQASASDCSVIINQNYRSGTVKFSYVNQAGSVPEDFALIDIKMTPLITPSAHFNMTVGGSDVCDISFKDVTLEYKALSDRVFAPELTEPDCVSGGYTTYVCSCGESYVADNVPSLGHVPSSSWTEDLTHHMKSCARCAVLLENTKELHTYNESEYIC